MATGNNHGRRTTCYFQFRVYSRWFDSRDMPLQETYDFSRFLFRNQAHAESCPPLRRYDRFIARSRIAADESIDSQSRPNGHALKERVPCFAPAHGKIEVS